MDLKLIPLFAVIVCLGNCCNKKPYYPPPDPYNMWDPWGTDDCGYRCRRVRRFIDYKDMVETGFFQKIRTQLSILPEEHQCKFETYDTDSDGLIRPAELESIFGVGEETNDLFAIMDFSDSDGMISLDEFCDVGPHLIRDCKDTQCLKRKTSDKK
ncbi:uncharacterized protein LOC132740746 [Ruditapes philippinarum]|uniref:uncharacterized protein LOC132740746 n=1 Tax=Ruditapes philippinarum TaxID=129788 RepID=UPI00295ABE86|nr:uncharacterized protein LOC132740746 [Ruditapes philippinarum]